MSIMEMIHRCCTCDTVDKSGEIVPSNAPELQIPHNELEPLPSAKISMKNMVANSAFTSNRFSVFKTSPQKSNRSKTKRSLDDNQTELRQTVKDFAAAAVRGVKVLGVDLRSHEQFPIVYLITKKLNEVNFFDFEYNEGPPLKFSMSSIEDCFGIEDTEKYNQACESVGIQLSDNEKERSVFLQFRSDNKNCPSNVVLLIENSKFHCERFITCIRILKLYARAVDQPNTNENDDASVSN